jgi:serine/threonine protein kinase
MGGVCCKDDSAVEEILTSEHLSHNLVREQHRQFDENYEIVEVIGEGSISKISKIKRKEIVVKSLGRTLRKTLSNAVLYPDVYYALKEIDTTMVSDVSIEEFHNEIELLKSLVRSSTSVTGDDATPRH